MNFVKFDNGHSTGVREIDRQLYHFGFLELAGSRAFDLWKLHIRADVAMAEAQQTTAAIRKISEDVRTARQEINRFSVQIDTFYEELGQCIREAQE
ncbi:MAG: hypothetical protein AB7T18_01705 [Alphaproteobacteria bacterium]